MSTIKISKDQLERLVEKEVTKKMAQLNENKKRPVIRRKPKTRTVQLTESQMINVIKKAAQEYMEQKNS